MEEHYSIHAEKGEIKEIPDIENTVLEVWQKDVEEVETVMEVEELVDFEDADGSNATFECNICDYECSSRDKLRGHIHYWHKRKGFQCKVCERTFTKVSIVDKY